jgi:predicted PurR-regulated permease PerM
MDKFKKLLLIPAIAVLSFGFLTFSQPTVTSAQSQSLVCRVFPFLQSIDALGVSNVLCTGDPNDTQAGLESAGTSAANMVQLLLSLVFIAVIVVAVYVIIKAAIKYIRSEGDESKVKDAQKAIKTVFMGVAALFVGILGIVLVLAFFQASGTVTAGESGGTGIQFLDNFLEGIGLIDRDMSK